MACRCCAFNAAWESDYKECMGAQIFFYSEFHHHHRHSPFSIYSPMILTPMQEAAGAAIQNQKNVLLLSPTGSGKTLAYLLPLLQRIEATNNRVQAVVVVPSRELALQVESVFKEQAKHLRGMSLYGGRPTMEEHRRLKEVLPQVVFATPGRLLDHIGKENINLLAVKMLVVDEYDKCLELGFREEMDSIADALAAVPQLVLTSATKFDEESAFDENSRHAPSLLNKRKMALVDYLNQQDSLEERLSIVQVNALEKDKLSTLTRLLTHLGSQSTIVFVAHRESADRIGRYLQEEKFSAVVYHGGMDQEQRERSLYRFRAGAATVLVSTDLAARGLDIPMVRAIVHYHLPLDEATFTHRSGRTARWEDTGSAFVLIGPEETMPEFVKNVDEVLDVASIVPKPHLPEWTVLYIGRGKKDKLSKADILGFLCKKGGLNASQIGRIDLAAHAAYAAVKRSVLKALLQRIGGEKIKGMKTLMEEMRR